MKEPIGRQANRAFPPVIERAQARSAAYSLLARLYRDGVSEDLLPAVEAIPGLSGTYPRNPETGTLDGDEAAADHYEVFGYNVFPYGSIFLDSGGDLGGAATGRVLDFYRQAGYAPAPSENGDHIAAELDFLAFLCGAEADAWEDRLPGVALRMQALQRRFLDEVLLPWVPVFVQAVRRHGVGFYAELAAFTLELSADHRQSLGGAPATPTALLVDEPPEILAEEKTGLKEIAGFLITSAYSGIYLSRSEIARLARRRRIPRGFGGRQQMLVNLLRSAAAYDALDRVVEDLQAAMEAWLGEYRSWSDDYPCLQVHLDSWLRRLEAGQTVLSRIEAELTNLLAQEAAGESTAGL